jgi:hypothetical protein
MNRNFSIVFILLVTLSIVNAIPFHKRATTFSKCPDPPDVNPLTVTADPDLAPGQTSKFAISGKLIPPAEQGSVLAIMFFGPDGQLVGEPIGQDICSTNTCPLDTIDTTADVPVPKELPAKSISVVAVGIPEGALSGCAFAPVGGGAPAGGDGGGDDGAPADGGDGGGDDGAPPASFRFTGI